MRFYEWANAQDHGVLQLVADESDICYPQVHAYYTESRVPNGDNAELIVAAIKRIDKHADVTIADLVTRRKGPKPAKRVSKRALAAAERARLKAARKPARKRRSTSVEASA